MVPSIRASSLRAATTTEQRTGALAAADEDCGRAASASHAGSRCTQRKFHNPASIIAKNSAAVAVKIRVGNIIDLKHPNSTVQPPEKSQNPNPNKPPHLLNWKIIGEPWETESGQKRL